MKWAIAMSVGHGCILWNGECFTNSEKAAAKFDTQALAEKAMYSIFMAQAPTDEDEAAVDARLYVQAVVG
jgi:hypothetical protein